ncbi:hypothetical protein [Hyphococcus sp.]|uniref:hypothetical protein n=1 Tax=Hyphococcus sp. TaxID=2038636 RepID=UPI00207DAAF7|nr:MAG: hypothetical protein DHS20C04_06950 [Marinicaulis sp.]
MGASLETIERRLRDMAGTQQRVVESIASIETRLDVLTDELQRTSTAIYRLNLSDERARNFLQKQDKALNDLTKLLLTIKKENDAE